MKRLLLAALPFLAALVAQAQAPPAVPALPDTERRTAYSISSSTCNCAVNFALYGDGSDYGNWMEVYLNGHLVAPNQWVITSTTGPIGNIPRPITDAILTFNSTQTGVVEIVGARRPRREAQFPENRGVPARDMNQTLNDIVAQNRETWDKINDVSGRVIMSQPGNGFLGMLPVPAACANLLLGFDASGLNPLCFPYPIFQTLVSGIAITNAILRGIASVNDLIIIRVGYYANGDSPPVVYRGSTAPCAFNSGAGDGGSQVPSSNGGCWLAEAFSTIDVRDFGAHGDFNGSTGTDDWAAIQHAVNYAETFQVAHASSSPLVTLSGLSYCINSPILIDAPSGFRFGDGTGVLVACGGTWSPGSVWPPTDPWTGTEPVGMIDVSGTSFNVTVNVDINGNGVPLVAAYAAHTAGGHALGGLLYEGKISNFGSYGIWHSVGIRGHNCFITQTRELVGRTGYGIYSAGTGDSLFTDCVAGWAKVPLYVDHDTIDFSFRSGHLYNGLKLADPSWAPINVIANGYGVQIIGNTIDNGSIINYIYPTGSPGLSDSITDLMVSNNFFEYAENAAPAMGPWIIFSTPNADSGHPRETWTQLGKIQITGNTFPTTPSSIKIIDLVTTGAGSWAQAATSFAERLNQGQPWDPFLDAGPPTIASNACGTGANGTIATGSTNGVGILRIGAAATATCTVSFSAYWSTVKTCALSPNNDIAADQVTTVARLNTVDGTGFIVHGTALANTNYNYVCR